MPCSQALIEGADRLQRLSMYEQGAGRINLLKSMKILQFNPSGPACACCGMDSCSRPSRCLLKTEQGSPPIHILLHVCVLWQMLLKQTSQVRAVVCAHPLPACVYRGSLVPEVTRLLQMPAQADLAGACHSRVWSPGGAQVA
eukprot:scaffold49394_cov22-Tisochrysis_lutea.AAC.4